MGTGYSRNDTSNNIADGNIINASDLDGEFDAIQSAFDASTGHTHDGTTAEGAPITVTGPAQEYVSTGTELRPKANNTYDLGSLSNQWKDLYVDGTGYIDSVDIDGGTIDGVTIGGSSAAAGTFTTATATTGNITTVNATTVDTTNIEVTNLKAKDGTAAGSIADSTGVVTLASSVLTTTDINGGTIDGVTIGGSSAAAGSFTTLGASGNATVGGTLGVTGLSTLASVDINGGNIDGTTIGSASAAAGTFTTATATTGNITTVNATTVDSTNVEVTNIKAKDGTASATVADSTGVMTIASSVLTTTDINGGTIDGVTIGGSSAGAITGTTITGSSATISGDLTVDTNTLHVDSANNRVGVGTTSPASALDVVGTVTADGLIIDDSANSGTVTTTMASNVVTHLANGSGAFASERWQLNDGGTPSTRMTLNTSGLDVTGTVTADGLTVDVTSITGQTLHNSAGVSVYSRYQNNSGNDNYLGYTGNNFEVFPNNTKALTVAAGGDISFYEDTGTTPKFFWDASTERLGIGTSSPANTLSIKGGPHQLDIETDTTGVTLESIDRSATSDPSDISYYARNGSHKFFNGQYTERMRIDASGNVGVGLAPLGWSSYNNVGLAGSGAHYGTGAGSTLSGISHGCYYDGTNWKYAYTGAGATRYEAVGLASPYQAWYTANSGTADATITFSEAMRIDSSGNVGIGTSSPYKSLTVGDTDATAWVTSGGSNVHLTVSPNGASGAFIVRTGGTNGNPSTTTERMRIDSSGNVTIGSTDAGNAGTLNLSVGLAGTTTGGVQLWSTTAGTHYLQFGDGTTGGDPYRGAVGYNHTADALLMLTAGSERMRIDSSGNVGIGLVPNATGGGYKALQLGLMTNWAFPSTGSAYRSHNLYYDGTNRKYVTTGTAHEYEQSSAGHVFSTAASGTAGTNVTLSEAMRIDSSGNVLIGGATAGTASAGNLVLVNGTAPTGNVTNGITLYAEDVSSSSELKVRDEAGNVTTLSPHNFELIPEGPSEEMAWSYYSERDGKRINVDMLKAIRILEQLSGEKLVHMT